MDVILRDDVEHLGEMGDVVRVRPGHARNYLIPRGLAVLADSKNLVSLAHEKRLVEDRRARKRKAAVAEADRIEGLVLETKVRAGDEDKLFGSVTNMDIEKLFAAQGVEVDRRRIDLQDPIKKLGTYRLTVGIEQDVKATFTLKVLSE
ncbi:MAG: 50S ribosomal protein L9 [Candidatus Binatia bacterium]|jgi:large subunit ribosomal protein L9|nr:50S ribosomal protein L9 [Candidatus Binatia bacterium]MDG1960181.1 50S ribosomal protein L9 [Candidatus Binatia bacterium]MDG2010628.1 50S ribosomal protein L9 [Candidatus Binatia bacterium]HAC79617.1 50S ribosomal protein L9 [Deltaproteobacteria bacterium]